MTMRARCNIIGTTTFYVMTLRQRAAVLVEKRVHYERKTRRKNWHHCGGTSPSSTTVTRSPPNSVARSYFPFICTATVTAVPRARIVRLYSSRVQSTALCRRRRRPYDLVVIVDECRCCTFHVSTYLIDFY